MFADPGVQGAGTCRHASVDKHTSQKTMIPNRAVKIPKMSVDMLTKQLTARAQTTAKKGGELQNE